MTDFACPPSAEPAALPTPPESGPALVLVADPDVHRRNACAAMLRAAGFAVAAVEDEAAALAVSAQLIAAVVVRHIAGSNTVVPTLCRQIRAAGRTRNVPVIVLTAFDDEHTREQIVRAGATAILTEPLKEDLLVRRVRQLVTHTGRRRRAS